MISVSIAKKPLICSNLRPAMCTTARASMLLMAKLAQYLQQLQYPTGLSCSGGAVCSSECRWTGPLAKEMKFSFLELESAHGQTTSAVTSCTCGVERTPSAKQRFRLQHALQCGTLGLRVQMGRSTFENSLTNASVFTNGLTTQNAWHFGVPGNGSTLQHAWHLEVAVP